MTDLHKIANSYASAGLSVIPVGKDKKPHCRWAEFQTHIADDRTLARWFSSQGNIAVVTGKVSGNLVAIDFDEHRIYQAWLEKVGDLSTGLVVQKTGHGFHVIFRCQEPIPNLKLAFVAE